MPARGGKSPGISREGFQAAGRGGLTGRIVLLALGAAVLGGLIQLTIAMVSLNGAVRAERISALQRSVEVLADVGRLRAEAGGWGEARELSGALASSLPGGRTAIYDARWSLLRASGPAGPLPAAEKLKALAGDPQAILESEGAIYAVRPVMTRTGAVGYVLAAFTPPPAQEAGLGLLLFSLPVLSLAFAALIPFLRPLSRVVLRPLANLEISVRTRGDNGKLAGFTRDDLLRPLLAAIDETQERTEASMRRMLAVAYTDPLTRLPNRHRFTMRLEALMSEGKGLGLVICDIGGLSEVNAAFGPAISDMALVAAAERLRTAMASAGLSGGLAGRIGETGFGLILPGFSDQETKAFMASAEQALSETMTLEGHQARVRPCLGAAIAPQDAAGGGDLLRRAEVALKEAQGQSALRYAVFDQRLHDRELARARLEQELRSGIEKGEFIAVFQPKVTLETGELAGAEALARWRRPDGGVVPPGVFVPIAEELGLVHLLGRNILRHACFAAAGWSRAGLKAAVSVNVSPLQFDDADFVSCVHQALDDSGLAPELLELEITESAAVADPERCSRIMWPLRNRGVRLAIDDFGTGHSNLAAITRLPFDTFKIDQQFVHALSDEGHAPAIIATILAMAEALGQETVAEGVETREQADFLLRRGCTIGQGYYYSPPLPAEEFETFIRTWRPRPAARFAA